MSAVASVVPDQPTILSYKLPKGKGKKDPHSSVSIRIGTTSFRCRPAIDGITLLEFADALSSARSVVAEDTELEAVEGEDSPGDAQAGLAAAKTMIGILEECILDYPAFRKFVRDNGLDVEFVMGVAGDLISAYTDRPTEQPSES